MRRAPPLARRARQRKGGATTSIINQRILDALDAAETIELARSLVRIPSYTPDDTAVARFLHDLFRREGFESCGYDEGSADR